MIGEVRQGLAKKPCSVSRKSKGKNERGRDHIHGRKVHLGLWGACIRSVWEYWCVCVVVITQMRPRKRQGWAGKGMAACRQWGVVVGVGTKPAKILSGGHHIYALRLPIQKVGGSD